MTNEYGIVVVDDDNVAREMLTEALRREGYRVIPAESGEEALAILDEEPQELVITDVRMSGMNGIELLKSIKERRPETMVIVVTAFGNSAVTIDAISAGAFDFISKPFKIEKIRRVVENALEKRSLIQESIKIEPVRTVKRSTNQIIGQSEAMIEVFKLIGRVSNTETTVLIIGESGTGKELVARAIHENSYRRDKPFLAINCGAMTESLLESELFGYEKGAFTGADKTHMGIFEAVNGGTCLLDEIGEMPHNMQSKLLRVLQDGEIRRVGSTRPIRVDVRILAATHRNLEQMVEKNLFREDLYYRLNVVNLHLPPLRERKEDIPQLVEYFLEDYIARNRQSPLRLARETMVMLQAYDWPGNVRELENVVESVATLAATHVIGPDNLPGRIRAGAKRDKYLERMLPETEESELLPMAEVERLYILRVLKAVEGNKSKAARVLGLDRKTLRLKLKQYGYEG
ncbi:MAG: sigma-54-dependent Fis family transcriptional regulator [Acidobacteria bacterium]|nr:sigma-54-dependent Fis family transcriptional regulator [Acidobacteriota bacterium]